MINVARKARPRRSPNRVTLVELDGTAVRQPTRDHAATWPAWTDNHHWVPTDQRDHVIGTDSRGEDVYESDCHEPTAEDLAWLRNLEAEEAAEKARVLATYLPCPEDVAEWEAIRRGQISEDELAMLAAGMPVG